VSVTLKCPVMTWSTYGEFLAFATTALNQARRFLLRRKVRRTLDSTTGAVLLGFSARLAAEHA
jgi:threonine/homoserine/homoserine lactone efflux protein